jgi:hypothetical protein
MFLHRNNDFNQIPDRRTRAKSGLFWNLMAPLLGTGGHYEAPVSTEIAHIRRAQEHYDRLNAAARGEPEKPSIVAEIVAEAVGHVAALKPLSALDAGKEWLLAKLSAGPVAAKSLERLADDDGVARRTLERARRALGLKPRRIGGRSFWALPDESANR